MGRIRRAGSRVVVFAALLLTLPAAGPGLEPSGAVVAAPVAVEEVHGAGVWDRALCLACGAGIFGVAGMTIGGFIVAGAMYPNMVAACGLQCLVAFG